MQIKHQENTGRQLVQRIIEKFFKKGVKVVSTTDRRI